MRHSTMYKKLLDQVTLTEIEKRCVRPRGLKCR